MVQPVVIGADQDQVGQLGGAAVFPMLNVVGVQTAGGAAAGHRAAAAAMLQRAAKPPADQPGRPPGPNDLTGAFEPHFSRGITGQVAALGVAEQRTQMQCRNMLFNVDMHHHGGVLPMRAASHLGVPPRLHQAHKRLHGARQRRHLIARAVTAVAIALPLGDQRLTM